MFVATHWPDIDRYKPETGWPIPKIGAVMHISVYVGWVAMWWWLLSAGGRPVGRSAITWLIIGGSAYAIFDELTQAIVARDPAIADFLYNLVGIVTAIAVLRAWQRRRLG